MYHSWAPNICLLMRAGDESGSRTSVVVLLIEMVVSRFLVDFFIECLRTLLTDLGSSISR